MVRFSEKYPVVMKKLYKDQEELLTFYDFPSEYLASIRTTNPIESAFAT
ncbi:MAG: transposase [Arsenophonus sp. NEOnobi-MAG3]